MTGKKTVCKEIVNRIQSLPVDGNIWHIYESRTPTPEEIEEHWRRGEQYEPRYALDQTTCAISDDDIVIEVRRVLLIDLFPDMKTLSSVCPARRTASNRLISLAPEHAEFVQTIKEWDATMGEYRKITQELADLRGKYQERFAGRTRKMLVNGLVRPSKVEEYTAVKMELMAEYESERLEKIALHDKLEEELNRLNKEINPTFASRRSSSLALWSTAGPSKSTTSA